MKKILLCISAAVLLLACNSKLKAQPQPHQTVPEQQPLQLICLTKLLIPAVGLPMYRMLI
jgi:hypothetical protein